ncbi:MAG: hypothetical protein ABIH00_07235 [Armatimonadota bacterium]
MEINKFISFLPGKENNKNEANKPGIPVRKELIKEKEEEWSIGGYSINTMRAEDLALLFEFIIVENKMSFKDALNMLLKLPNKKISEMLFWVNTKHEGKNLKAEYFSRIAEADFNKAIEIIMPCKIKDEESDKYILYAHMILKVLPDKLRTKIIEKIQSIDPGYVNEINKKGFLRKEDAEFTQDEKNLLEDMFEEEATRSLKETFFPRENK